MPHLPHRKPIGGPSFCAKTIPVAEHDGLLWVWRGQSLAADARRLPRRDGGGGGGGGTLTVDTVLDYGSEWHEVSTG